MSNVNVKALDWAKILVLLTQLIAIFGPLVVKARPAGCCEDSELCDCCKEAIAAQVEALSHMVHIHGCCGPKNA